MSNLVLSFLNRKEKHHYHLVDNSQLPFITSTAAMLLVMSFVLYFHKSIIANLFDTDAFSSAWFLFSLGLFVWFLMVLFESGQGYHTWVVRNGLRFGMVLFIVSEVMFFFAFFWSFFHVSLAPSISVGSIWPPRSLQSLDVWGLPLINTILLLSSGVTITFAHRAILENIDGEEYDDFLNHLSATVFLGTVFLFCQWIEYKYGIIFRWKENVYGTTFFVTTGFHGFHVSIGTIFLLFCLIRTLLSSKYSPISPEKKEEFLNFLKKNIDLIVKFAKTIQKNFWINWVTQKIDVVQEELEKKTELKKNQHLGFEAAAWYWHFVDVVWIFLFISVYWWNC